VSRAFGQFFKFQISIFNSRVTLVSLVVLLLSGCFEEAVQESMEVTFERDGTVQVRVDVVVAHEGATPAMEQRLQQLRGELLDGRDAWARRFERVKPKGDSFGWAREQGQLRSVTRIARMNPDDLEKLFFDTAIQLRYHEDRGYAELAIFAGASQRATRDQARQYDEAADEWSKAVSRYYRSLDELYGYTASYPERAEGMFAIVFEEIEDDDEPRESAGDDAVAPPPDRGDAQPSEGEEVVVVTEEEHAMAMRVVEALEAVLDAQGWAGGRDLSADELARLVNDPFPADLLIRTGGEIEDVEGFVRDSEAGGVRVPRTGLLEALRSMRGKWASPDPFHELLDHLEQGDATRPIDLAAFLAKPRSASPPRDWREVRKALEKELKPVGTYRVRWVRRPQPD
jgi:hypothetical protein